MAEEPTDPEEQREGGEQDPGAAAEEYLGALMLRASRTFQGEPVAIKVRAIVGVPRIPDAEVAAQAAWNKLRNGDRPSASELAALELVIRLMRPAPLSRSGILDPLPSVQGRGPYNPDTVEAWDAFRFAVKPLLYSIGRLDRASGQDAAVGTAFLVRKDLVLTNRHVVSELSMGTDALDVGQAVITFNQEADTVDPDGSRFPIVEIVALHPRVDLALLRVDLPAPRPSVELSTEAARVASEVAAIGYPYKDGRNPLFVSAIYGSRYGVKRAAIGQVTGMRGSSIFHDCSTLGGSSGSPVFCLSSCKVVGVHYTGHFMYRNEAVAADEVASFVAQARG